MAVTTDLYEASLHHGLVSASFVTPFLSMVGMTSAHGNELWRSKLVDAVRQTRRRASNGRAIRWSTISMRLATSSCSSTRSVPQQTLPGSSTFRKSTHPEALRKSLRAIYGQACETWTSQQVASAHPCSSAARPIGEPVHYRVPLMANARRFKAGNRMRLFVTSDDQNPDTPAIMSFRHASVGTSSLNTIKSSPRLILSVLPAPA
jgi:hypothetical protein